MKRFLTGGLFGVTAVEMAVLIFARLARGKYPFVDAVALSLMMLPFCFATKRLQEALPACKKPSDDGMYSIAGTGLQAIAEAESNDWRAVAFYSAYMCAIPAMWFLVL